MSVQSIVDIIHSKSLDNWKERNELAFQSLFGAGGRYPKAAEKEFALRAPEMSSDSGVPFSAYIHPSNPKSGAYSGLSFVMFPVSGECCLIGLGIGTQGLNPDEAILGRPGHARKTQAICSWLNAKYGKGEQIAWAKGDPTRADITAPDALKAKWSAYKSVFERYGKEMYALFKPTEDPTATIEAVAAFLDVVVNERGFNTLAASIENADHLRVQWSAHLLPQVSQSEVAQYLKSRRFVILQGPPGTGKTTLAQRLLKDEYHDFGTSIQFHPNTTYESFIGGLAPQQTESDLGLRFAPAPGMLIQAALEAKRDPSRPYLLHIDEINRADLSKVLGEAIYLFEPNPELPRKITLAHEFKGLGHELQLPENLHILGTMNTSDRSIAIVDVAVRRRFSFLTLWPQTEVVQQNACELMQTAFADLLSIFIEHASDDAFNLMPGHSYFLERDKHEAARRLKVELLPLLEEYLSQGYVGGFAEPLRGYIQGLRSL